MACFIGLTGGIGSGKTLVGKIFSIIGIPVFNADEETKKIYDTNDELREKLINLLGEEIYKGKILQRGIMAERIFADKVLLGKVNSLVHPVVNRCFEAFASRQKAAYVLLESAILFESGINRSMKKTITVAAPENVRIRRVMWRDTIAEEAVRQRMQHQWTDEQRRAAADFEIINDGQQAVLPQVIKVHEQLIKL